MIKSLKKFVDKNIILIILLLSIPAVRYLFVHGFFGVSDDLHIGWLYEMDRVIKMFQFPPRYVPDLSYGFGYPLFNFVYPLPFYIGEIFHLIGFSLVNSVKIVFGLSVPFSMYFMYMLLKTYLPKDLSLAGSVLYVYMPYRAVELFVRGSIGEIVAFVFFPLTVLSFINLTSNKVSKKWVGIAALSTAALVLSHNIMAYMFFPFVLILVVARIIWFVKNKKRAIVQSLSGLTLGFLASIYFWFPAIFESKLMQYDTVFNFYNHYPTLKQFITPYFGYGASVAGPYDTMSFYFGLVGLLVVLVGSILFVTKFKNYSRSEKIFFLWGILIFFVSIFMMNHRSAFLWRNLPLLPYFQFPWRFIAMICFSTPLLLLGFVKIFKKNAKVSMLVSFVIIISAIVLNFNYFKTSEYLGREDDYYLNRYIPSLNASDEYKQTSEEYLRLPVDNQKRPDKVYPRAFTKDTSVELDIQEINALDGKIDTDSEKDFVFNYNKYNYPGWSAKIDGEIVKIVSGEPYGQISFMVPAGKHVVEVGYSESPFRMIFDLISLAAFGVSLFLIFKSIKK